MKALVWHAPYDVRLETVVDPTILEPTDVIVRVTAAAICGTDLHPYRGRIPEFMPGTVLGHEFAGVVEAAGSGVMRMTVGDRVVASDVVVDGDCWFCRRSWHWQCVSRTMFGWGPLLGENLRGGQAELVRVPTADRTLFAIPRNMTYEQALFVGDILATGYVGAMNGGIRPGDTVAVVGCGPVGTLAQLCARLFAPAQVLALDRISSRLELAQAVGSVAVPVGDDARRIILEATDGRGADSVIECVGSPEALRLALELVRRRGTISVVGAHFEEDFAWPSGTAFDNELTLRFGAGDPLAYGEQLLQLVHREVIDPTVIVSHRLPLEDGPRAYGVFDRAEATKVVLTTSPGSSN